jgi:hypothetical protein
VIKWLKSIPKSVYILAFIGTFLCVFTNELNRKALNSSLKNQYGLIQTADEPSYLVPPQNWIKTGLWKDNSDGIASYVQRPPGYGMLYLVNFLVLGKTALFGLKLLQIILFFFSGLLLWRILEEFDIAKNWKWIAFVLFLFLPSYSGFVYYSMTEGVTPFFMLWVVFESLQSSKKKKPSLGLFMSFTFLLLIRPQLAFIPLVVFFYHLVQRQWKTSLVILLSFIPIFGWYFRTAMISGEAPSVHPIYFKTNNSMYRPTHAAMTDLYRIWEWRSDVFHTHMGIASRGDSLTIENLRKEIPTEISNSILPILHRFGALNQYRISHFAGKEINGYFSGEKAFMKDVKELRKKLIAENSFQYYIKTPSKSASEFLNKSYMNLYIFQATLRGNYCIEFLRIFCWFVILASIGLFFLTPFFTKLRSIEFFLFIGIAAFLFYLVFFQRLNEERYIVPLLPVFLVFGFRNLGECFRKFESLKI